MEKQVEIFLPTEFGNFNSSIYTDHEEKEHILMIHEKTDGENPVLVRIPSECTTGDLFHSLRCVTEVINYGNRCKRYQKKAAFLFI